MKVKVAAVQYEITGGLSWESFERKMAAAVGEARRHEAELVVFPELFSMDLFGTGSSLEDELRFIDGMARELAPRFFEHVEAMSRESGVAIQAGTFPRFSEGRIVNTAVLTLPDGRSALQDKLYLTPAERSDWKWIGGNSLKVLDAPWGRTVILVCYDSEIPGLSSELALICPELILVPSCTASIHGFHRVRWCAQARAIEHCAYVVTVGTVGRGTGTPNMNSHYGRAAFLTPSDEGFERVLLEGPLNVPFVAVAELDFGRLRAAREGTGVYPARDQLRRESAVRVLPGWVSENARVASDSGS